jgi:hypothetical protein
MGTKKVGTSAGPRTEAKVILHKWDGFESNPLLPASIRPLLVGTQSPLALGVVVSTTGSRDIQASWLPLSDLRHDWFRSFFSYTLSDHLIISYFATV